MRSRIAVGLLSLTLASIGLVGTAHADSDGRSACKRIDGLLYGEPFSKQERKDLLQAARSLRHSNVQGARKIAERLGDAKTDARRAVAVSRAFDWCDQRNQFATTNSAPTTSDEPAIPFGVTVDDFVEQWNTVAVQVLSGGGSPVSNLTATEQGEHLFGGDVTDVSSIYLGGTSPGDPVNYVIVKVTGASGGQITTPTQLLAIVGGTLFDLTSAIQVVDEFRVNALPRLSSISGDKATTISVGSYLDLHVVVVGDAVAFAYTRVGERLPSAVYRLPG